MTARYAALRAWRRRRWLAAAGAAVVSLLVVAVPTDLIDTPAFSRGVPPTWWSWPALLASALLAGLLFATYVRETSGPADDASPRPGDEDAAGRRTRLWGGAGGVLTFFAVGCPVCNKIVLLAWGAGGAMTWFEPVQPVLSVAALILLAWALGRRLDGAASCAVRPSADEARRG